MSFSDFIKNGRVGKYCTDHRLSEEQVDGMFNDFKKSHVHNIMKAAIEDFKDYKVKRFINSDIGHPAYDRIAAIYAFELNMCEWFSEFIENVQGMKKISDGPDKGTEDLRKYV